MWLRWKTDITHNIVSQLEAKSCWSDFKLKLHKKFVLNYSFNATMFPPFSLSPSSDVFSLMCWVYNCSLITLFKVLFKFNVRSYSRLLCCWERKIFFLFPYACSDAQLHTRLCFCTNAFKSAREYCTNGVKMV